MGWAPIEFLSKAALSPALRHMWLVQIPNTSLGLAVHWDWQTSVAPVSATPEINHP